MINEITGADAIHPLAQAGVELPKPKEPVVADPEGIKGMDSAQDAGRFCAASIGLPFACRFGVCHFASAFLPEPRELRCFSQKAGAPSIIATRLCW